MPYMIDGHNLIAATQGMSLSDPDDERALIDVVAGFARRSWRSITVYFDRGSLLAPKLTKIAGVKIHFVRPPRTADDALRAHILRLGREAPNWTVVSSDREVQRAAQHAGARVATSQAFASELMSPADASTEGEKPELTLSEREVAAWEALFQDPDNESSKNSS